MIVAEQAGVAGEKEDEPRGAVITGGRPGRGGECLWNVHEDVVRDVRREGHCFLGLATVVRSTQSMEGELQRAEKATAGSTWSFAARADWLA